MKYTYVTDYKDNDKLRKSLNELTEKTFGFSFEKWYSEGFWNNKYIPHSLLDGDRIIAAVFVNLMDFEIDGTKKHYIQIGTVMTDKEYRGQGLSRYLIEKIIHQYKDKSDGIYLFCHDGVIDFYPKFGFIKSEQYQYSKNVNSIGNAKKVEPVDMSDKANLGKVYNAAKSSTSNHRFNADNPELVAFWTMGRSTVYYLKEEDAYIVAKVKDENLCINQIIADHKVNLEKVIRSFGSEIKKVILGFTPYNEDGFTVEKYYEKDCTLYILGKDLESIENKKLMFPILSYA